jgi:DNA-binding NarL/FixJ family response regulator
MRNSPVRVAVMSESAIVRAGLVGLVGQLGDRAMVVDTDLSEEHCGQVDVVVYDLGAAPGPAGFPELRRLAGLGLPMVALVYDGFAGPGGRAVGGTDLAGGAQLISLAVSAEELGEALARAVPSPASRHADRLDPGGSGLPSGLTHRELTVISLIGAGLSNKQIAEQMYISGNTIKTYIRTAYRKLGIRSRIQAALWAMEHGLVARPVHEKVTNGAPDPAGSSAEQP